MVYNETMMIIITTTTIIITIIIIIIIIIIQFSDPIPHIIYSGNYYTKLKYLLIKISL